MRSLTKKMHKGQKGLTLIELLIVVAILGIIAAVVIPNLGGFMVTGRIAAANTEVENVKTASLAFYAENSGWPTGSANMTILEEQFISGELTGTYEFSSTGFIIGGDGWGDLHWCAGLPGDESGAGGRHGTWVRNEGQCP